MNTEDYLLSRLENLEEELAELKAENRALKAENNQLKIEKTMLEQSRNRLATRFGNIMGDNRRLLKLNERLSEAVGGKPSARRYDDEGNYIPPQQQ